MAQRNFVQDDEEATISPPPVVFSKQRLARRLFLNRLASVVVRMGGIAVLLSILAIFVVILFEALPLFRAPSATLQKQFPAPFSSAPLVVGSSENGELFFGVERSGEIRFVSLLDGRNSSLSLPVDHTAGEYLIAAKESASNRLLLGRGDGSILPVELSMASDPITREMQTSVTPGEPLAIGELSPIITLRAVRSGNFSIVAMLRQSAGEQRVGVHSTITKRAMTGASTSRQSFTEVPLPKAIEVSSIELSPDAKVLYLGTAAGEVLWYSLQDISQPRLLGRLQVDNERAGISALKVLIGGLTLVVGTENGQVSSWMFVEGMPLAGGKLVKVHTFKSHSKKIGQIFRSERNRTFLSVDQSNEIHLSYSTTGKDLITIAADTFAPIMVAFSPKGDRVTQLSADKISKYEIHNPYPEASFASLFSPVWYEGYSSPSYVWQSSSGSDEFEPKLSLVPLIYGTLKGTLYSLLFAVPIAVLSAVFTSEFMSSRLKNIVKPIIELMAALPSVVLGFIAGIWLAPVLGSLIPGLFLLPFVIAVSTFVGVIAFERLPLNIRHYCKGGGELLFLVPLIILSFWISFELGSWAELKFFDGSYQHWLTQRFGIQFDQRNSMVVGVAMGFAIIPLIFTISEDAIASVPGHLRAASLALGASRWQTALRVTLPAASPGVFAGIMLGFGRAIGETMIVLMATGNTPIMNASMFNGFRALSANIAVELPEAAAGGTLFRILFFAALLLFCLTFVVNTMTEMVRTRLRKRYGMFG